MKIDEEVYVNGLKTIDKLCDKIINNKDYIADEWTQNIVEDICEIANRILHEHEK